MLKLMKFRVRVNQGYCLFGCVLALVPMVARGDNATLPAYIIKAEIDRDAHIIQGTVKISFRNHSTQTIEQVPIIVYPNVYKQPPAYLNDVNFEWVYPQRFNAGWMEAELLKVSKHKLIKKKPFVWLISLASPLAPKSSITMELNFSTHIPERFGEFGHSKGSYTLGGGWHPYIPSMDSNGHWQLHLPPPQARFDCDLNYQGHLFVNERHYYADTRQVASVRGLKARQLTLIQTPKLRRLEIHSSRSRATLFLSGRHRRSRERDLQTSIRQALHYFEQVYPDRTDVVTVVEVPLRTEITVGVGGSLVLLSDRALKIYPGLRKYHRAHLFQALFTAMEKNRVNQMEQHGDQLWVQEAVSWFHTEQLLQSTFIGQRDARQLPLIRMLSFLPSIDQVIYTPQFPFTSAYYNLNLATPFYRQGFLRYNRKVSSGRFVLEKLGNQYGKADTNQLMHDYLASENHLPLRRLAQKRFGSESEIFFRQWLYEQPRVNYSIRSIRKIIKPDRKIYSIVIARSGKIELPEPVSVLVKDRQGKTQLYRWDGHNDLYTLEFTTTDKIAYVHLDPQKRLSETSRADNRVPPQYKLVMTAFVFGLDFSNLDSNLLIATQLRRIYGGKNRYNAAFSVDDSLVDFSLGYSRLFGRLIDRLRLSHGLGISYTLSSLNADFLSSSFGTQVSPSGNSTKISVGYGFGNRLSLFNPMEGIGFSAFFTAGLEALGGDFDFFRTGFAYAHIIPFDPQHLLATRIAFGISGDDSIPPQEQFALGGVDSLRGFAFGDPRLVGRSRLQFNTEYRHTYINDLDINLFHLARFRKVQGVLFFDAGRVTGSVVEQQQDPSGFSGYDIGGLFDLGDYFVNSGYGLRIYYDALGIRNSLLRFDVANRLNPDLAFDPIYYLAFTQAF